MTWGVRYAKTAVENFVKIGKNSASKIIAKLDTYCAAANPLRFAKPLTGAFDGLYRFRIGVYRVIFEIDRRGQVTILWILTVQHRKDVYR